MTEIDYVKGDSDISSKLSLRTLAAHVDKSCRPPTTLKALSSSLAAEVSQVRNTPLARCASSEQLLAVLTKRALLDVFQRHKALRVVDWIEAPQKGQKPDADPPILVLVTLKGHRDFDVSALMVAFNHVNLVQSAHRSDSFDKSPVERHCWPVHDSCFNIAMVVHAAGDAGNCSKLTCGLVQRPPQDEDDQYGWQRSIAGHFGVDVADYFAWVNHYTQCLWFLGCFGILFRLIQVYVSAKTYDKVRPFFSLIVILFNAIEVEFSTNISDKLREVEVEERSCRVSWSVDNEDDASPTRIILQEEVAQTSAPQTHESEDRMEVRFNLGFEGTNAEGLDSDDAHSIEKPFATPPVENMMAHWSIYDETDLVPGERQPEDLTSLPVLKARTAEQLAFDDTFSTIAVNGAQGSQIMPRNDSGSSQLDCFTLTEMTHAVGHALADLAYQAPMRVGEVGDGVAERAKELREMGHEVAEQARALYRGDVPTWKRWANTLVLMPLLFIYFVAVQAVFVGLFWFEMWVIFTWGECARINKENGDENCLSPVPFRGFVAGFLMEISPSVTEGILLELLLAISKCMAALVCDRQNWKTQSEYDFALFIQCVIFEMCGKVGFVMVLAFWFVPDWGIINSDTCEGMYDEWLFGKHALSCIKLETSYKLRLYLLQRAMKGPMLVSMLIGMLLKVCLPRLICHMHRGSLSVDLGNFTFRRMQGTPRQIIIWLGMLPARLCCGCWRGFWRIVGLIFLFDCGIVGGPLFVWRSVRPPKTKKREIASRERSGGEFEEPSQDEETPERSEPRSQGVESSGQSGSLEGEASSPSQPPASQPSEQAFAPSNSGLTHTTNSVLGTGFVSLDEAFLQGMRREYCVLDEYLEVLLHFTFFTFFGMVWPLGCFFALMNYLLKFRFDVLKLGYVRRRAFAKPDQSLRRLVRVSTRLVAFTGIIVQTGLLLFPYELLEVWMSSRYKGLKVSQYWKSCLVAGLVTALVLLVFYLLSRTLLSVYCGSSIYRWARRCTS